MTSRLRIIVAGLVGLYPVGGGAWDYLQSLIGLARPEHRVRLTVAILLAGAVAGTSVPGAARAVQPVPPTTTVPRPTPAPAETVQGLQATLVQARTRFEARDTAGVLAYVSDEYRSGPLTKALIREQLLGIFGLYEAVRARVTIDRVDLVRGDAWVYTTGELSGRLPVVHRWITFLSWESEPEVARREGPTWRLYGFHDQPAARSRTGGAKRLRDHVVRSAERGRSPWRAAPSLLEDAPGAMLCLTQSGAVRAAPVPVDSAPRPSRLALSYGTHSSPA